MIALLLGSSSAFSADEAAKTNPSKSRVPTVTVSVAEAATVTARVPISGTLVPREEVLVNPQITGYAIESIKVDIGDAVEAGDVLAVLNDSTLAAEVTQAEAELLRADAAVRQAQNQIDAAQASTDEADATLDRTEQLKASGSLSQASLNQAKAAALSARAALASAQDGLQVANAQVVQATSQRDLAKINLARAKILAPVGGLVSARNAKVGAIAATGTEPMFRIIRDGQIEIEAEVIETELGAIALGDAVEATIAGNGTVTGTVRLIAPTVDQDTRLGLVRVALQGNNVLRAGTFASGWITTDSHSATTVPSSAVLTDQGGEFVQIVDEGTIARRKVVAGLFSENGVREIIDGIEVGETVVSRAGAFFRDGDRVRPIAPEAASEKAAAQ